MNTVNVKFLKYHSWGSKGDVVNVSEDVAARLVKNKVAVIVPSDPKPEPAKAGAKGKTKGDHPKISNKAMSA